jgi:hypothetical protein
MRKRQAGERFLESICTVYFGTILCGSIASGVGGVKKKSGPLSCFLLLLLEKELLFFVSYVPLG